MNEGARTECLLCVHTEEIRVYLSVGERAAFSMRAAGNEVAGKGQLSEAHGTFRGEREFIRELVFLETSFRGLHGQKGSGGSGMVEN